MPSLGFNRVLAAGWRRFGRRATIVLGSLLLFVASGGVVAALTALLQAHWPRWEPGELAPILVEKAGLSLVLAALFSRFGTWRRFGFRGGLGLRYWPALLPLWTASITGALGGVHVGTLGAGLGWVVASLAVAFTEEAVFRGIVPDALSPWGYRGATIGSALLFGAMHLVGFLALDPRVVLAQASYATGLGLCLGWVRFASGSIWPGFAAHALMDAIGLLGGGGFAEAMGYDPIGMIFISAYAALSVAWGLALVLGRGQRGLVNCTEAAAALSAR